MRPLPLLPAVIALAACGRAPERPAEPPPAVPATIAVADFRYLAHLDGAWRGTGPDSLVFYERYRLADDSTIVSYTYGTDSTLTAAVDSGDIRWSGGQVRTGSPTARWVATHWSADSVRFDPDIGATNSFTWIRRSADAWMARLDSPGGPAPTVYEMTRVGE